MKFIQNRVGEPSGAAGRLQLAASVTTGSRAAQSDPRWPSVAAALAELREQHRHAVRIVDADCACGTLLIETARYARGLGFTAIEGHGIDGAPTLIGRARASAARLQEPAIGLTFECADMVEALVREADFPADIVLFHCRHEGSDHRAAAALLAAAGKVVIGDPVATSVRRQAA